MKRSKDVTNGRGGIRKIFALNQHHLSPPIQQSCLKCDAPNTLFRALLPAFNVLKDRSATPT